MNICSIKMNDLTIVINLIKGTYFLIKARKKNFQEQ